MMTSLFRAGLVATALVMAGCSADSTFQDINPKAEKQLPAKIVGEMKAKGMERNAPVMARIFKEEGKLEIWKQKVNGRYDMISSYDICKWSGELGPKYIEGDRQAPEGFYTVRPAQMNPRSSFHLAFNIGYPNAYDRANGRTGANLMVHGACSSSGCYSMTDEQMEQIYAYGRDAFRGGQTEFQIQAFPFRMTAANMARYRNDPNYEFWTMLKEGYDQFEITKVPPKVDVCEKRYVFNRIPEGVAGFSPTGACPASTQPESLTTAYQSYKKNYEIAFASATAKDLLPPKPSIVGLKEANLVAEWTRARAKGQRVPLDPPSMEHDGTVKTTARMGRIDSPAGRKQAALDAAAAEKAKAEEARKALALAKEEEKKALALAKAEAKTAKPAASAAVAGTVPLPGAATEPAAETEAASAAPAVKPGLIGNVRKRFTGIFGS
jgi:murein L,D-transpeptidase YafK